MALALRRARPRAVLLSIALASALALTSAGSAAAVIIPATCDDLDTKLAAADHDHEIVLSGICNEQYTLPSFAPPGPAESYKFWTLRGDPSNGQDGFDGSGLPGRVLTGVDVHRLELQNLLFRDSTATGFGTSDGGAISITGDSAPAIRNSTFLNNTADGTGGAVFVENDSPGFLSSVGISGNVFGSESDPAEGNEANGGGALAVEIRSGGGNSSVNGNVFASNVADNTGGAFRFTLAATEVAENVSVDNNTVVSNRAAGAAGGGYVFVGEASFLNIRNNLFDRNAVEPIPGVLTPPRDHVGGGLWVESEGSQVQLSNNDFMSNAVNTVPGGENYAGGGLAVEGGGVLADSQFDVFVGNTVAGQATGSQFESEGGGVFLSGSGSTFHGWLDVIAGNQVGDAGEGGGVYVGGGGTALELSDTTVVANSVGPGGSNAGLGGGGGDRLQLQNSIVHNPAPDIGGFSNVSVQYTDACVGPGTPFSGTANICADPQLVDPAAGDVHQTKQSPTIDKGNDELFLAEEGENPMIDFEGDPRPTDGDSDGHTVDMGADETPAGFIAQQPPPPPPPPPPTPQCADGVDNDGDTAVDQADPGCLSGAGETYNAADANEGDEGLRELVLCGRRPLSLVRADARGRRVVLTGLVGSQLAGREVDLFVRFLRGGGKRTKLATVTPGADGQFVARVKGPPRRLFNVARYQARVGDARSVELKLPQSLESTTIRAEGDTILLRGRVDRPLLGRRNPVVIKRVLCGQYQTVGQARPNRRGVYVVRFPAPDIALAALYRAETRVLSRPGSTRYVRQFARAVSITLTGQSG